MKNKLWHGTVDMAAGQELLKVVYDTMRRLTGTVAELPWSAADDEAMAAKAAEPSNFDGDNFKGATWRSGAARHHYLLADHHHLLTVGASSSRLLEAMAAILSGMDDGKSYTIYYFANDARRTFPDVGKPAGPVNVNGGYCMACDPRTIVIYRREDALRVLIHELQHAACLDNHAQPEPTVEAETEAWAEIFYAMFGAVVHGLTPEVAWRIQTAWSAAQNRRLREEFGVHDPGDYVWRYTVGKEEVWRRMGLAINNSKGPKSASMKLGAPQLDVV